MPRFLILARDASDDVAAFRRLSPAEMEAAIQKYIVWSRGLRGKVGSDKLTDGGGRVMAKRNGRLAVTDGPFSEVKEIVGGYWIVEAASYDAVQKLCETSPHLDHGTLEIRQIEQT